MKPKMKRFARLTADPINTLLAVVVVWGAVSLIEIHDTVLTGETDEPMLAVHR